jgi:hypothetical protein
MTALVPIPGPPGMPSRLQVGAVQVPSPLDGVHSRIRMFDCPRFLQRSARNALVLCLNVIALPRLEDTRGLSTGAYALTFTVTADPTVHEIPFLVRYAGCLAPVTCESQRPILHGLCALA